ncbi:MAG: CDP-alcohol phosphatidyltransferase family protein [Planctomycetes bacterium]|nr:CDP-alcohol phosphatidyltransferase family protein [Planctomycetota bacterium]
MRRVTALPNLLTLANAFCGLLAIAKAIDALVLSGSAANAPVFYEKLETACLLIFLGMVFDALDGKVARLVGGSSEFGAQLDSFSDALTFGVAPALLAKVLIEHEGPALGYSGHPRLHFIAAASFALMAILRLARFNLETTTDESSHRDFKGLPSPAAAGAVVSTLLLYLVLRRPQLEVDEAGPTPLGRLISFFPELRIESMPWWVLPAIALLLPLYGSLMVSRVRYVHAVSFLTRKGSFFLLVYLCFAAFLLFVAPIPVLFLAFQGFALFGALRALFPRKSDEPEVDDEDEIFAHGGRD